MGVCAMQRSALALCLVAAVIVLAACNLPTNASGSPAIRTALPTLTPSATAVTLALEEATATPTTTTADSASDETSGAVASSGWTSGSTTTGSTSGSTTSGSSTTNTTSSSGSFYVPPCVVRTDWPIYAVVRGDTLSSIARRTGTTATVLAASNCLNDPNRLETGQVLRVPNVPLPPTAIPQVNQYPPPGEYGSLTAAPLQNVEALPGGGQRLIVGARTTITIRWLNYPPGNLTQAEIVYIPSDSTIPAMSLNIDTNLADGITAVWTVPANAAGRLLASAPLPGQNHEFVYSPEIWVRAVPAQSTPIPTPGTYGTLRIVPALGTESFDGTTRYRVQAGDNVTAIWEGFPDGLLQIEITYIPLDRTKPAVSLGIDQNPADGISAAWSVPSGANGQVIASSRLSGENHPFVYSPTIWVIDVNAAAP